MKELSPDDLRRLSDEEGAPRLSLFLPLSPRPPRSARAGMLTEHLLAHAERGLRSEGLPRAQADELVARAGQALRQTHAPGDRVRGVAVFADQERVRRYRLPLPLPRLAVVGDRFSVTPLLPTLGIDGSFFVLALTRECIRLFKGAASGLTPVDLGCYGLGAWVTMPAPVRRAAAGPFLPGAARDRPGEVFAGPDRAPDERRYRALQHYRGVDRALRSVLGAGSPQLVLAGSRSLQTLYRTVNTYCGLVPQGIDRHPDDLAAEVLHGLAWAIAEPGIRAQREATIHRYRDIRGTDRTVEHPDEVLRAAVAGRVECLLVGESACSWRDPGGAPDAIRLRPGASGEHVLEHVVRSTLAGAGEIVVVPDTRLGHGVTMAAILRE